MKFAVMCAKLRINIKGAVFLLILKTNFLCIYIKEVFIEFLCLFGDCAKLIFFSSNSDSLEPTQFTTCTAAAVRNVPENPENGAGRPISAASGAGFKPSGPQYAEKTSGWESSKQPGKLLKCLFGC